MSDVLKLAKELKFDIRKMLEKLEAKKQQRKKDLV
jgi:hypothetical protein